eukprot:768457-Pyramimonas_sp.AAC.1
MRTDLSYASEEVASRVRPFCSAPVSLPQSGARAPRLEDVLDQEGRQVLIEGADRMLTSPQEWGEVIETSPHLTPYFDEVLRADQIAYEGFVKDLSHAGILEFSFE